MKFLPSAFRAIIFVIGILFAGPMASVAMGQPVGPPGAPTNLRCMVTGTSVVILWEYPIPNTGGGVEWFELEARLNGVAVPGSPFNTGRESRAEGSGLAVGTWSIEVYAANGAGRTRSALGPLSNGCPFTITGAQPPSAPTGLTALVGGTTVSINWNAPGTGGAVRNYEIEVTFPNGDVTIFTLTSAVSITATVSTPGIYFIRVRAVSLLNVAGAWSSTASFTIVGAAVPGMPTLNQPSVSGSTVTLSWSPPTTGGVPTGYDIEGFIQATGQTVNLSVGNVTSTSIPGVPPGNFLVRIRARNASGAGAYTTQRLIVVGVTLRTGDLQVTLTWNTALDMDLHVIEPSGRHVYYSTPNGITAFLDRDDTNGYGPENIYVGANQAATGNYQVYLVHWGASVPTTSTVAIVLYPNSSNERSTIISRTTTTQNRSLGINVANVDVRGRTITEVGGTRATDQRELSDEKPKDPGGE